MPSAKNHTNTNSGKAGSNPLFEAFNPDQIMNNAQKVLSSAVNVLEEEIAAGILAAKKMESRVIDVDDIREDPRDLMNRIRRDIHEAVDLLMDSVTALTRHFGTVSENLTGNSQKTANTTPADKARAVPIITSAKPVYPGETALLEMTLSNDKSEETVTVDFIKTDLSGPATAKIPARQILIKPRPLLLKPGQKQTLQLQIKVPKTTRQGMYSALFTDQNDSTNRIIVQLEIA